MKKAFLQLHLAILFAGFTAIFGKLIDLNEGMLVLYRMLLSAIILGGFLFITKKNIRISSKEFLKICGVGSIVALHWVSFYGSIKYSNVSVAVTCFSAVGFFTAFIEPAIVRRKVELTEVALGLLVIAGIYLIFNFYPEYKTGLIFGIISAFFASIFAVLNKILLVKHSASAITFYEMAGGFMILCFFVPLYLQFFDSPNSNPSFNDWMWLLILALVCTVIAFILSLNALKSISAFTANLSYNLEPVYSILLAFILFDEHKFLGRGFYMGITLILFAVVLQMIREWKKRKEKSKKAELVQVNNLAV